ncbi:MAG: hypothetical protein DMG66_04600, partial [Acidobacteria bacterium]
IPQGGSNITGQPNILARVGDDNITIEDVARRAEEFQRSQGRQIPPAMMPQLVDYMITDRAQLLQAQRLGLRVSDAELKDELQHGPLSTYIFPDGKFVGQEKYQNFVTQQLQSSVEHFEEQERNYILQRKLTALVTSNISVTPADIEREYQRQNLKVKLQYAVVSLADLSKQITVSEPEIKAYYQSHKSQYENSVPEKRKAKYAVIDVGKLAAGEQISPSELLSYYNQHKSEFQQQEEIKASHILIKTEAGPDGKVSAAADAAARKKAEDILKKLRAGANFEELAKKESDDKASAINGGSLGFFQRGSMVPEFEKAAFSLNKGQISDLVKTQYGYHIIRVDDKHQAGTPSIEQVKEKIEPFLKQQKAQREAEALANSVQSEAGSQGLDAAAAKHALPVVTSDWFARGDSLPGLGAAPEFMQAVFSAQEKSPPQSVGTQLGYVVFQVTGVKPPATPTFAEIRSQVESQFKTEKAAGMLEQKAAQISDRARALHDLKKAAKEVGAEVKTSDWLGAQSQAPDLGNMGGPASVAFAMKPGEISAPLFQGRTAAVLMVTDRQEAPAGDVVKTQDQIRDQLLRTKRQEALELYLAGMVKRLEKEGKIRKNQQQIDAYTRRSTLGG